MCVGTTLLSAKKWDNETMTNVHVYYTHFEPGYELHMDFGITVILMISHSSRNCDHLKEKSFLEPLKEEADSVIQLKLSRLRPSPLNHCDKSLTLKSWP